MKNIIKDPADGNSDSSLDKSAQNDIDKGAIKMTELKTEAQIKIDDEFSKFVPPLSSDEYKQLESNIHAEGCRDPLIVWEEENLLIDGHNRFRICTENKISYQVQKKSFQNRDAAIVWIIDNQLGRRNLQPIDKVPMVEKKREILEAAARERQNKQLKKGDELPVVVNLPQRARKETSGRTRDKLAETVGVSGKTYDALAKTVQHGTQELIEAVREKKIGAATASVIAEMPVEEQREIINKNEKVIIAKAREMKAAKPEKIKKKALSLETVEVKDTSAGYSAIVINLPWFLNLRGLSQSGQDCVAMKEAELAIPCTKDCHIWVWSSHEYLPVAFKLLEKWGLEHVCTFAWHKTTVAPAVGQLQYNCEFAVYAKKGSPEFISSEPIQVCFDAASGNYGEKPEVFYEMIRKSTSGRKLTMFCRQKIDGFDSKEAA